MSNVLADDKHHQIVALGRLGWSLRGIKKATGFGRRHAVRVVQDLAQMSERGKNRFLQTRNDG